MRILSVLLVFLLSLSAVQAVPLTAWAMQPKPAEVDIQVGFRTLRGFAVQLSNHYDFPVVVQLRPGSLSSLHFKEFTLRVGAKASAVSPVISPTEQPIGIQVLNIETQVYTDKQEKLLGPGFHQPYLISKQAVKAITFEQAFLSRRVPQRQKSKVADMKLGGEFVKHSSISPLQFKSTKLPPGAQIQPLKLESPQVFSKMQLKQLPRVSEPKQGARKRPGAGSGVNLESERDELAPEAWNFFLNPESDQPAVSPAANAIRGNMSLKTDSSTYKAAWGWVVQAWQNVAGINLFLGWAYVDGAGNWQIDLPVVIPGLPVWVDYMAGNRFVEVNDPSGNTYTWGDHWNLSGSLTDIGGRYADLTVTGDLPGLAPIYEGATELWSGFYYHGMNALRDQPIQVTYPNSLSTGFCIVKDDPAHPYPWSCSYSKDGKIWLIADHAKKTVIEHECGHSIDSFHRGGTMPAGSGGTHGLTGCYNTGLALSEGFADFLAFWGQIDRAAVSPSVPEWGYSIESPESTICSGQTNEWRVAATFWDMHDYWNDGADPASSYDSLMYTDPASAVAIYLNNPRETMADYLDVVKSGQSAYWQGEFTKLFRLNTIVP